MNLAMSDKNPNVAGNEAVDGGIDEVVRCLSSERRRVLLDVLDETGGGTFGEVVADLSEEIHGEDYTSTQRKRIYVALYQNHAPLLQEAGVVVFEGTREDECLKPGPAFREAKDALDALRRSLERSSRERGGPAFRPLRDLL